MNRYVLTGEAKQDLTDINRILFDDAPQAATRFLQRFDQKCQLLAKFPEMGRIWKELNPPLRSFPIDKHLIFYRPIPSGIEVIRVLSGYRDLEAVFREGDPE